MVISKSITTYKGYDITRIEGRRIKNSIKNTQRGQFYANKDTNPLVKYIEYSVAFATWNYSSDRLKDIKNEIDSQTKH
jgi:hypothetical protein